MSDSDSINNMFIDIKRHFNQNIDILVNNAGIQHVDYIEDFPDQKWEDVISINLSSAFYTIKNAISGMKENKFGRVINIASAHGLVASEKKAAYVAAKAWYCWF